SLNRRNHPRQPPTPSREMRGCRKMTSAIALSSGAPAPEAHTYAASRGEAWCSPHAPHARLYCREPGSERDLVVEVLRRRPALATAPARWPTSLGTAARGAAEALVGGLGCIATAFAAPAVEHGQFAAEPLQHHLGGVALLARLVGPFPGL